MNIALQMYELLGMARGPGSLAVEIRLCCGFAPAGISCFDGRMTRRTVAAIAFGHRAPVSGSCALQHTRSQGNPIEYEQVQRSRVSATWSPYPEYPWAQADRSLMRTEEESESPGSTLIGRTNPGRECVATDERRTWAF